MPQETFVRVNDLEVSNFFDKTSISGDKYFIVINYVLDATKVRF